MIAKLTFNSAIYIPKKIVQGSAGILNIFLDEDVPRQLQKVRPPRFVSFTMELEPYSKKKAFALEILNEINLNVIEAETIQKLYTMSQTVVIITAKRIICVEEQFTRPTISGLPLLPTQQTEFHSTGGQVYKHWNVFFKDIVRVSIDIIDRENQTLGKELERFIGQDNDIKTLLFMLKVHYIVSDEKV